VIDVLVRSGALSGRNYIRGEHRIADFFAPQSTAKIPFCFAHVKMTRCDDAGTLSVNKHHPASFILQFHSRSDGFCDCVTQRMSQPRSLIRHYVAFH